MSKEYILNRIRITGKLNDATPHYVITEIIRAHNICIAKPINSIENLLDGIKLIESYRCITIKEPFSTRDLRLLATYVNIDCNTWTKSSLLEAYEHMHSSSKKDLESIFYSQKSYENIKAYNACMLYSLCKSYNIDTSWNMKPETMCFLLKQLTLSLCSLKDQLNSYIEQMNKSSLVNLLSNILNTKNKKITSKELEIVSTKETPKVTLPPIISLEVSNLTESLNNYKNSNYILKQINPKTHYDAIILSALIYNLNLTESSCPFEEFMRLKSLNNLALYKPIDKDFRKKYLRNPEWYNLTIYWEPKLSFIYDEAGLKKLCVHEGFNHEDFRSYGCESLLQISRISLNVFLGKNVYSDEEEYTAIDLTDIKDLDNEDCITIGNMESKDTQTYTFEELAKHFSINKNFTNPVKPNEVFEPRLIRKIGIYASNLNKTEMLEAIEIVQKWQSYSTEYTDKLREIFKHNYNIIDFLYKVFDCGLYMRGWKVTNENYPLKESLTLYDKLEGALQRIETNVYNSINEVFERVKLYREDEIKVLENLPLMKISMEKDKFSYIISPDPDDGKSILDRLRIVLNGDKHKNMKSCIRLTSNIILISIHYYLCSLGIHEPFSLNELDHIT
jgi:hypothetical protein